MKDYDREDDYARKVARQGIALKLLMVLAVVNVLLNTGACVLTFAK